MAAGAVGAAMAAGAVGAAMAAGAVSIARDFARCLHLPFMLTLLRAIALAMALLMTIMFDSDIILSAGPVVVVCSKRE
jgi:hypothetical protein